MQKSRWIVIRKKYRKISKIYSPKKVFARGGYLRGFISWRVISYFPGTLTFFSLDLACGERTPATMCDLTLSPLHQVEYSMHRITRAVGHISLHVFCRVTVWISSATRDLMLIQQNKFQTVTFCSLHACTTNAHINTPLHRLLLIYRETVNVFLCKLADWQWKLHPQSRKEGKFAAETSFLTLAGQFCNNNLQSSHSRTLPACRQRNLKAYRTIRRQTTRGQSGRGLDNTRTSQLADSKFLKIVELLYFICTLNLTITLTLTLLNISSV